MAARPRHGYAEMGDGMSADSHNQQADRAVYSAELIQAVLEMPGRTEAECFAAMEHDPALYRIMGVELTGRDDDQRPILLKQVKAELARSIGLCKFCDRPVELIAGVATCVKCSNAGMPSARELVTA